MGLLFIQRLFLIIFRISDYQGLSFGLFNVQQLLLLPLFLILVSIVSHSSTSPLL